MNTNNTHAHNTGTHNTHTHDTGALVDTVAAIVITSITALMVVGIGSYVTTVNQKQWTRSEALRIIDEYTATARRVDCIRNYHIQGCKPKCEPDNLDPKIDGVATLDIKTDGVLGGSMTHFAASLLAYVSNPPKAAHPYCLIPTGILATLKKPPLNNPLEPSDIKPDARGDATGRHSLFLYKHFVGMGDAQATEDGHESLFDVEWVDYYLVEPGCKANRPPRAAREITVTWQEVSGNSNERSITRTALGPAVPNTMGWHAAPVASPDEAGGTGTETDPDLLLVDTVHIDDETIHKLTRGFTSRVLGNLPSWLSIDALSGKNPITGDSRPVPKLAQDLLQGNILDLPSKRQKDKPDSLADQKKQLDSILKFLGISDEELESITGTGADITKGKLSIPTGRDRDKIGADFLTPVPLGYEFYVNTVKGNDGTPHSYELVKFDPENPTDTTKSNIDLANPANLADIDIIRGTVYGPVAKDNKREICAVVVAPAGSTAQIPDSRRPPKVDPDKPPPPPGTKTITFYPGGATDATTQPTT